MKKFRIGIGTMLMVLLGLSSCKKEEIAPVTPTTATETQGPSKTELITGSYSITLAVVNGDTVDPNDPYMDQTFVIESDGTGAQILYATHDSVTYEFSKPLEWYFGSNEEIWNMRTKDLDENGEPVEEWGDWIPFTVLRLTENEFWYGLSSPSFSMEFHLEKQ